MPTRLRAHLHNASRWWHRHLIYPATGSLLGEGSLRSQLEGLKKLQYEPTARLHERQKDALLTILRHAHRSTAYYREAIPPAALLNPQSAWRQLPLIPLLDKAKVQHEARALTDAGFSGRRTRKTTGGSTGQAVTILKNRDATAAERAGMWLGYSWRGIQIGDRAARFWGVPLNANSRLRARLGDMVMNRIRFSAFAFGPRELDSYWERCLRFRPDYFHGYVSMLVAFANHIERRGVDGRRLGLRAIVCTSEVLHPTQRRLLERIFGAPILVEYGCGEVGPIAYDCEYGRLHELTPNVLVELLDSQGVPVDVGQVGEVVVTDLINRAMPLIRYRLGDFAVRGDGCDCGRGFPTIAEVLGRAYDFIEDEHGRRYHGEFLLYAFEELRAKGINAGQFRATQSGPRQLEVDVVSEQSDWEQVERALAEWFGRNLSGFEVILRPCAAIPRRPSGKAEVVVNRWRKEGVPR